MEAEPTPNWPMSRPSCFSGPEVEWLNGTAPSIVAFLARTRRVVIPWISTTGWSLSRKDYRKGELEFRGSVNCEPVLFAIIMEAVYLRFSNLWSSHSKEHPIQICLQIGTVSNVVIGYIAQNAEQRGKNDYMWFITRERERSTKLTKTHQVQFTNTILTLTTDFLVSISERLAFGRF